MAELRRRNALWWMADPGANKWFQRSPYQISFSANWICLEVVTVVVIAPAPACSAPVLSKRALLSTGGEKFGWLKILKTSTRNCALKFSDIFVNFIFLKRDMSKLISPGPVNSLRLEFPSRFAQVPGMPRLGGTAAGSNP